MPSSQFTLKNEFFLLPNKDVKNVFFSLWPMVSVTNHWPVLNSAKFYGNIDIPWKWAKPAARLKIRIERADASQHIST